MKFFYKALPVFWMLSEGVLAGPWSAWMPENIVAFEGTCVVIPCRFNYPEELRPSVVHGIWYFNSPYPKNYPPVVYKSRTNIVHESYVGRTRLTGDLNSRNCSLQITRLSPELTGKYYFRGDLGGYNQYTYSEHCNLEIINQPSIVTPPEVLEGSEVELRCVVPDNCPEMKPIVSWSNHEGLKEYSVYGQVEEEGSTWSLISTLKFLPSRENNHQELACKVTYINTTFEFDAYSALDVKYVPRIVQANSSSEVIQGSPVVLVCTVDSNPLALISWLRDDDVLYEAQGGSLTLHVENITYLQDGIYTCVAENIYGKENHSLALTVMYAPWKPIVNGSVVAVEGDPVTILCSTQSNPEPIITIFKEKKVMKTVVYSNQLALEFASVTHEDDGEYWCIAENQFGQSSSPFNLTVEFAPLILTESKCTAARDTVQCVCAAKSNPEAVIIFKLPSRNVTVNETDREFVYSQRTGYTVTSILTLRGEVDSQLYIVCSAKNFYGTKDQQLHFHHSNSLMWAKVGPVGAVVAFAILIAVVCYVSQTRRKKNMNENSSFMQTENPPVIYSGDYKTPGNLEKSEYGRHPGTDKRLLNKREDLGIDYANIDFTKLSTKDSYTLTEELAEYAEIRVK
ncbi:myelin-associated glycoprotein isoform X1 [Sphaerodactylus townsendi]|uniref:myelin-associated glycoprotein isoform X1 n=1 Tax=Sphaerodactylus townsendi TaxID=933632 RepID=UPI0020265D25|nr:myelin-associated glycoprotein isoform X1 [Sphaerodactylus townsendi]XP_048355938.1 myelin-associated glycoprotein isoform X1 [Sphaerodactylus townsendi]XP_048355939.1 myelin-associated glycoprotein isoform X1 [Sphaerodactylus townsendi]XP_048355940.1 myelin-associated glycoprotein isoform X1 [Sphaerodactylus townsendi]XP_048355941.1 myelin-associated glycoprotein isoform X1 [Sphaerodactylus townsendi]XP_048355942.1 myelin-associated glycoprotein isoform X1 [Sphaerodactylus townsendi]